jgi:hypothetical protein
MQNELLQGAFSSMRRSRRRHVFHGTAAARPLDMPAVALLFPCDRPCGYPVRTRAIMPQSLRLSGRKKYRITSYSYAIGDAHRRPVPAGASSRPRATMGLRWGENKTSYRWKKVASLPLLRQPRTDGRDPLAAAPAKHRPRPAPPVDLTGLEESLWQPPIRRNT